MLVHLKRKEKKHFKAIRLGYSREHTEFKGALEKAILNERSPLYYYRAKGEGKYLRKSKRLNHPKKEGDLFKGCSKEVFFKALTNPKDKPKEHLCFNWLWKS